MVLLLELLYLRFIFLYDFCISLLWFASWLHNWLLLLTHSSIVPQCLPSHNSVVLLLNLWMQIVPPTFWRSYLGMNGGVFGWTVDWRERDGARGQFLFIGRNGYTSNRMHITKHVWIIIIWNVVDLNTHIVADIIILSNIDLHHSIALRDNASFSYWVPLRRTHYLRGDWDLQEDKAWIRIAAGRALDGDQLYPST